MRIKLAVIALLFSSPSAAGPKSLDLGGLVIVLSDAPTAQIFHIVDQLSQWEIYSHKQYSRWADSTKLLDERDRELLLQHAKMRKQRGSGHGFEQTFLVDDSIENAAIKGVAEGFLPSDEANAERDILLHFAPKLQPLLRERQGEIDRLKQRLESEQMRLTPTVRQLARFAEVKDPPTVTVFLVSNTEERSGGGEANGGRLVIEVPSPDAIGALLHESLHQLLRPQQALIRSAAETAALDFTVLNEGIAYALYPGITGETDGGDRLIEQLVTMQLRGVPTTDRYLQFDLMAAVIRPLLRTALAQNETITAFLPKAIAKWRSITPK
ncbi:MAG TPA: hypothetical protein VHW24_08295 [Bryobacteraceae bacterium]|nr:hypothetical protein [Bryobacteraceae bacterium]